MSLWRTLDQHGEPYSSVRPIFRPKSGWGDPGAIVSNDCYEDRALFQRMALSSHRAALPAAMRAARGTERQMMRVRHKRPRNKPQATTSCCRASKRAPRTLVRIERNVRLSVMTNENMSLRRKPAVASIRRSRTACAASMTARSAMATTPRQQALNDANGCRVGRQSPLFAVDEPVHSTALAKRRQLHRARTTRDSRARRMPGAHSRCC